MFFLLANVVMAFDFTINVGSMPSGMYEGESKSINAEIVASLDNVCNMKCRWEHAGSSDWFVEDLKKGDPAEFSFPVTTGSSGIYNIDLKVNCDPVLSITCWSGLVDSEEKTKTIYFTYSYLGDGTCDISDREDCTKDSSEPSCGCSSPKSCIDDEGDSNRDDLDQKKCATYCGNNEVEKKYEKCENCPYDVGKCDGESCSKVSECEGNYCVHNICSHEPYRKNDGYCDVDVGENCNSKPDCECKGNTRCEINSPYADYKGCATWCGNGVCEVEEQGVCADDCDWCGDGDCQEGKETCRECSEDCGECEQTVQEETAVKQLGQIKKETQILAQETQKQKTIVQMTTSGTIGLVLLIIVGWIIFRVIQAKKSKGKSKPKEKDKKEKSNVKICKKCKYENSKSAKFCNKCGKKIK